jgi:hypothetical protein
MCISFYHPNCVLLFVECQHTVKRGKRKKKTKTKLNHHLKDKVCFVSCIEQFKDSGVFVTISNLTDRMSTYSEEENNYEKKKNELILHLKE